MMIVDLTDERAMDSTLTGGKGSSLASLVARGLPVPLGFVVTTQAFAAFLEGGELGTQFERLFSVPPETSANVLMELAKHVQDCIRTSRLPEAIAEELKKRIIESEREFGSEALWAVRSSAVAEDLVGASFAGQYDTILGLAGLEEVVHAVLQCWASFFNVSSIEYRRARNIQDFRGAVVLQRLIPAYAAGVCFTQNPVSGSPDKVVINSSFGLGESVVSGRVTPDTFVVDKRSWQVTSRKLAVKETRVVPVVGGAREEAVEESLRQQASLSDDETIAIAKLAVAIEGSENHPVDMEWAVLDGAVYVLQSRPITTLPSNDQPSAKMPPDDWVPELNTPIDPRYPLYSNGNIGEVLPGCITPLSWSYIGPTIEHAFRSQGIALGVMKRSGPEYQVLGFFYHRPYICVSFMEDVAARTPGLTPDTIHEEFIGPPETRTPPISLGDLLPHRWPAIVRVVLTFLRKTRSLGGDTENCEESIDRQRKESTPEKLKTWSDMSLIEEVRLSKSMMRVSDVHIWASTFAVVYFDLLRKLTKRWLDDEDGSLAAQMVTGINALPSADPAFGLYTLAQDVLSSPQVKEHFESVSDNRSLLAALNEDSASEGFLSELEDFLSVHGHRAVCEAELRTPCWREDPAQVLGFVRNYLRSGMTPPEAVRKRQDRVRDEAAQRVDALPLLKRVLLRRILKAVRRNIELRELLKDLVVLRSDRFRQIYAEVCDRLLKRGCLPNPDDLYFLVSKEVGDLLAGGLSADAAKDIISGRRQDFEWCQMVHVPKVLDGEARVITADDFPADQQLIGTGVSPGKVEGRARLIIDPRVDSYIEPGEILVAPVTDAGWTPLFISAGGLVIDVGGLLSHGSIVAREYGLPAVVGVTGATQRIKTGDRIYLDGSSGVVIKLD